MADNELVQLKEKCNKIRERHNEKSAKSNFDCSVCPAQLICDVPLKKRWLLFSNGK
ncbi:MAG: hypothetical protein WCO98_03620 [bacterium]